MIDHHAMQLALRDKLDDLEAATTGTTDLEATATGYARSTGSFLTDGFRTGMELEGSGFASSENNDTSTITAVTATAITCAGTVAEAEASGRKLVVGLPSGQAWEGTHFDPTSGEPYVVESYIPGPTAKITLGKLAELEVEPQYQVQVHVPANTGMYAASKYVDALITLFAPGTALTVGSDTLRVRGDTGPFRGQLTPSRAGWITIPVTFPLRLRTANSI